MPRLMRQSFKIANRLMKMKVLVSVDAEGLQGVTFGTQVIPGERDYTVGKEAMILSANAVAEGLFKSGADEVTVVDAHDGNRNIDAKGLDRRARAILGWPKPLSMAQGVGESDALVLLGYHSKAGTLDGVLSHTYSTYIHRAFINGFEAGEAYLTSAVAGEFNVPVKMFAGDDKAVMEAQEFLKDCEFVVLKKGLSRYSADSLPMEGACDMLTSAAASAMGRKGTVVKVKGPIEVKVEFNNPAMADNCMIVNGAKRVDGYTVSATAENMLQAYNTFRVFASLSDFDHGKY